MQASRFGTLDDGNETGHAQRIVRELYQRYEKQLQRWRDYRKLFCFLFFVAWYLATLYIQRSANVAFMVHSTLDDVLNPRVKVMQTQADVYTWLTNTLNVREQRGGGRRPACFCCRERRHQVDIDGLPPFA